MPKTKKNAESSTRSFAYVDNLPKWKSGDFSGLRGVLNVAKDARPSTRSFAYVDYLPKWKSGNFSDLPYPGGCK